MCKQPYTHCKMKTTRCNFRWLRSDGWCCALLLVAILFIALCTQSCKPRVLEQSTQELAQTIATKTDSTTHEIRIQRTQTIPRDTVQKVLSLTSLHKLPEGALYSKRQGRAEVKISRKDSLIYVYASCDSLAQMVDYYERMAQRANDRYHAYREQFDTRLEEMKIPPWKPFLWGFILGIAGTLFTILKFKRK